MLRFILKDDYLIFLLNFNFKKAHDNLEI